LAKVCAALAVFVYHFDGDYESFIGRPWLNSVGLRIGDALGTWGVCVFVVISGLTLGWSYGHRRVSDSGFWPSRFLRIYPTYWWVAVPLTVVAALSGNLSTGDYWKVPIWWAGVNFVSPATFFPVVNAWWYIGLAMQLYVLAAFVCWLNRRRGGSLAIAAVAAGLPLVYEVVLPRAGALAPYLACWFVGLAFAAIFGLGFLASMALWPIEASSPRRREYVLAMGLLSVAVTLSAVWWSEQRVYAAAAVFVLVTARLGLRGDGASMSVRVVEWLASLSFVFYLCHSPWVKPVIRFASSVGLNSPGAQFVACLAVAGLATLSFYYSLRLVLRIGRARRNRVPRSSTPAQ
jgi:peptidoglycan/LPS O-acetylase OafA/YrhL